MSPRLLIVDDEHAWLDFTQRKLGELSGFEVETVSGLEATQKALVTSPYDLIIGSSRQLDVLGKLRQQFPEQKFVVATSQPTTTEGIASYRLGALDYFSKDFRTEVIASRVCEAIEKQIKSRY